MEEIYDFSIFKNDLKWIENKFSGRKSDVILFLRTTFIE